MQIYRSIILIFVIFLTACDSNPPPTETKVSPIRMGLIAPLKSTLTLFGQSSVNAAQLAVQHANARGGLQVGAQKRPITLIIEDDQDNPLLSVQVALKLINQENVVAIVGPQASRNAIPVAKIAENAKIPMISPSSTHPETTANKQYVFRAAFVDDLQGQIMARFARQDLKALRVAILYDIASEYNKGLATLFKHSFEQEGGKIVSFQSYTTGEKDFSQQLKAILKSKAELIFLPNYDTEIPEQVKQARQLGITVPFIGSDTWFSIAPEHRAPLEGMFFSALWAPDNTDERSQAFSKLYQQTYHTDVDDVAALTYDAFGLLFQAIEQQNSADPTAIRSGLANIKNYQGVSGAIGFHGSGDPLKSVIILQIKQGRYVFYKSVNP